MWILPVRNNLPILEQEIKAKGCPNHNTAQLIFVVILKHEQ